jgi:hypothetical protein
LRDARVLLLTPSLVLALATIPTHASILDWCFAKYAGWWLLRMDAKANGLRLEQAPAARSAVHCS